LNELRTCNWRNSWQEKRIHSKSKDEREKG
jgi:hypothetical protein